MQKKNKSRHIIYFLLINPVFWMTFYLRESTMNQPLSPVEQAKVFFFFFLLTVLSLIMGAGSPLALVTVWGLYKMRSTKDFSYIETVRIIHKGLSVIPIIVLLIIIQAEAGGYDVLTVMVQIVLSLMIYPVYYLLLNTLFYVPLSKHKEWVVANGIFSTAPVETKYARTAPWISFGKSASIADELIKLNNLKDANLITLDEFNTLRSKLLS